MIDYFPCSEKLLSTAIMISTLASNSQGRFQKIVLGGAHCGLESPKTTKRDDECVEGERFGSGFRLPPLQSTRGLGERHKLLQRGLGLGAIFWHYSVISCMF